MKGVNVEKKIIFLTFRVISDVATILEESQADYVVGKRLSDEKIVKAESFSDRDKIARLLAAYSYDMAMKFAEKQKYKLHLQWMKLAARLLNMSLKPKKLADLDEIKKVVAQIKREQAVSK